MNGQPVVQPMLFLGLSCDHRVVDGARGAWFLGAVAGFPAGASSTPGHTTTMPALREHSLAIDGGAATGAPADDFDGRPRSLDGNGDGTSAYDIGAYESPF